jgi:hypothetical protein
VKRLTRLNCVVTKSGQGISSVTVIVSEMQGTDTPELLPLFKV